MSLYQSSVLKKFLASQDDALMRTVYEDYKKYFFDAEIQDNIRNSKEEQFQEGFLRELFVNLLGYTINPNPNFNLTTELKNIKGAKKTDGAILDDGSAIAVIELKGTDTKDLEKVTEQAFNYKNNQPDCVYVVTSNFEKLRFYIHNAVNHIEFNLFTLTYEEFRLLWLLLQKDNLLGGIPVRLKQESLLEEEKVTKRLYKDYSAFKNDLWSDMCEQNPVEDELELYKKSQKLLDRFLFIFFAEDKGLLPPNSISQIVKEWSQLKDLDAYTPLYERIKLFFTYLNEGRNVTGKDIIHAYNGGLFSEDHLLERVSISDEVLGQHILKLTEYDFDSEVDTNILGHIFEHSLSEIENVRAQLAGEEVDKSKTKRKKDGVFYTPKYITKYIVESTIGKLCEEKKTELGIVDEEFAKKRKGRRKNTLKKLDALLKKYREWLLQLTICDPACGSGAFLNEALEFLIEEHRYLDELESQLLGYPMVFPDIENHILERNLYGVDINEESIEIARLSLWLRTAKKGRKLTSLSNNIKVGNSLIDDPKVAGDLAFNWKEQFINVFDQGGFDVVIGNPPYTYRNALIEAEKSYLSYTYKSSQGNHDLYKYFIEQSAFLTKPEGFTSMIVPNTFMSATSYSKLRKFLLSKFSIIELYDLGLSIFDNVVVESVVFNFQRTKNPSNTHCNVKIQRDRNKPFDQVQASYAIDLTKYGGVDNTFNIYISHEYASVIDKIKQKTKELGQICYCTVGINTGYIKNDLCAKAKLDDRYHKMLNGKDIGRNTVSWNGEWIMYDADYVKSRGKKGRSLPPEYIFSSNKILVQRTRRGMKRKLVCYYDTDRFYNLNRLSNIVLEDKTYDLKAIYALLNSRLLDFYFNVYFNEYEVKPVHLAKLPIANSIKSNNDLSMLAQSILDLNNQLMGARNSFLDLLRSKLLFDNPSKKLVRWYDLDFRSFLTELKKKKVKLSLEEEAEWIGFFKKQKKEANNLQAEIDRIDRQIDQMVYELYGLSEEEIATVENNA